jgi:hypothetical protein
MAHLLSSLRSMRPRTLGRVWAVGLVLEAAIILGLVATSDRPDPRPSLFPDSMFARPAQPAPSIGQVLRDSAVQRMLADSLGLTTRTQDNLTTIRSSGGTVVVFDTAGPIDLRLSPEAQTSLATMGESLGRSIDNMVREMIATLLLLASIPVSLILLTITWFGARHWWPEPIASQVPHQ